MEVVDVVVVEFHADVVTLALCVVMLVREVFEQPLEVLYMYPFSMPLLLVF